MRACRGGAGGPRDTLPGTLLTHGAHVGMHARICAPVATELVACACAAPQDELSFKGVVFNEMKGVYSSPDSVFYRAVQQALFPDNTYRCGGANNIDQSICLF